MARRGGGGEGDTSNPLYSIFNDLDTSVCLCFHACHREKQRLGKSTDY